MLPKLALQAFAVFSLCVVFVSIFSLCASTSPSFQEPMTLHAYADYFGVDTSVLVEDWSDTEHASKISTVCPQSHDRSRRSTDRNNRSTNSTQYTPHKHLWVPNPYLEVFDCACYVFFFVEIVVRLIFCPSFKRYFRSVLNWMDILLVIFFIVEMAIDHLVKGEMYEMSWADALFILRVCRVFKIFRLAHHHKGVKVLVYTLRASLKEIVLLLMFLAIGVLIFSCLIYYTDHGTDKFQSIPHCFWWAIITMTTVGYGDMYPETVWGKLVGTACAVSGVLMIAFAVPIIVNNFMMFYELVEYEKHHPLGKDLNKSQCESISVPVTELSEIPSHTVQAWASDQMIR